jgi:hypothetical protein
MLQPAYVPGLRRDGISAVLTSTCAVCYNSFAHIVAYIAKKLPQFLLNGVAEAWR